MVQFFKGSPDPRDAAWGQLATALGEGIGKGVTTYQANKALQDVLNDKSYADAPLSAKMGRLQSVLGKYGEIGKNVLQEQLMTEKQASEEKEIKKQEAIKKQTGKAVKKYFNGEELSPEEEELFTPAEFVAMHKAKNPQPKGGVTAQPIPQEQITAIEDYMKANPNAAADELAIGLGKAGVNPVYSDLYIENRRREKENTVKQQNAENKIANANDIKFHQESKEYEDALIKETKSAKKNIETIEDLEKDIHRIKPFSLANVLKGTGTIGDKIAKANLTKEQAKLLSAIPELLEGKKEIFGVRLSDADLRTVQDKIPDIGNSVEANKELLRIAKKYAKRAVLRSEAAETVLNQHGVQTKNGKLRPLNYAQMVEKEHERLIGEEENGIMMKLPDGREVPIERSKIKEAEALGAKRLNK